MEEVDYCRDPRDVRVIPGAAGRLRQFRERGWAIVIISNQSGIGRGIITMEQYEAVHAELVRQIEGQLDGAYFCPDAPPNVTRRRKPDIGMVEEAVRDLNLDLAKSWFIGDKRADVECGHNAGMPAILVHTGYGKENTGCGAEFEAADVVEALDWILAREKVSA